MINRRLLTLFLLTGILTFPTAFAASFESFEQSAARLGTANAGTTTNTNDAAIEFYNSAAMAFVKHPAISISGIGIFANISMYNAKATDYLGQPTTGKVKGPISEGVMPAFHLVVPVTDRFALGGGITVPYGLETIYPHNTIARYFATKSIIQTINFGVNAAFKLTDKLSIGAGFDAERIWAELDQAVDVGSILGPIGQIVGIPNDIYYKNSGDSWGYGYNVGLFYQFTPATKAGFSYNSSIKQSIKGSSKITTKIPNTPLAINLLRAFGFADGKIDSNITLPANMAFSIQHNVNNKWTLLGDVQFTKWDVFKNLTMNLSAQPNNPQVITLKYHNSWRIAVGQIYKINNRWSISNGFAFDETPTDATYKTARIPDANRYWITLGTNYAFPCGFNVDFAYGLILFSHSEIKQDMAPLAPYGKTTLDANYKALAHLVGIQINYNFGKK